MKTTNIECLGIPGPSRKHSKNLLRSHDSLVVEVRLNLKEPWNYTFTQESAPCNHSQKSLGARLLVGAVSAPTEHGPVTSSLHLFQRQNSEHQSVSASVAKGGDVASLASLAAQPLSVSPIPTLCFIFAVYPFYKSEMSQCFLVLCP